MLIVCLIFSLGLLQGLATIMLKAGEGQEMLEMLKRAVETAVETQRTKEAKNLRMLLGQMHTLQVSYFWFFKFTTKRKISEG